MSTSGGLGFRGVVGDDGLVGVVGINGIGVRIGITTRVGFGLGIGASASRSKDPLASLLALPVFPSSTPAVSSSELPENSWANILVRLVLYQVRNYKITG